jgi:hypothetical protein
VAVKGYEVMSWSKLFLIAIAVAATACTTTNYAAVGVVNVSAEGTLADKQDNLTKVSTNVVNEKFQRWQGGDVEPEFDFHFNTQDVGSKTLISVECNVSGLTQSRTTRIIEVEFIGTNSIVDTAHLTKKSLDACVDALVEVVATSEQAAATDGN